MATVVQFPFFSRPLSSFGGVPDFGLSSVCATKRNCLGLWVESKGVHRWLKGTSIIPTLMILIVMNILIILINTNSLIIISLDGSCFLFRRPCTRLKTTRHGALYQHKSSPRNCRKPVKASQSPRVHSTASLVKAP